MAAIEGLEQDLARLIRESAPGIVKSVVAKAQEGSYLHAKFLFELVGIDLTQSGEEAGDGESLAAYLLRELKDPGHEDPAVAG